MSRKYTAIYFIAKFEAIPIENWTTGSFLDANNRCCSLGHCGWFGDGDVEAAPEEAKQLVALFLRSGLPHPVVINDAHLKNIDDLGDTSKERIINALVLIDAGLAREAMPHEI